MRHVGKQQNRQRKHQDGANHPVLHKRQNKHPRVTKNVTQLLILHLGQRRVHHDNKANGNEHVGGAHLKMVPEPRNARGEIAGEHSDAHGKKDPERQITVKKRQLF